MNINDFLAGTQETITADVFEGVTSLTMKFVGVSGNVSVTGGTSTKRVSQPTKYIIPNSVKTLICGDADNQIPNGVDIVFSTSPSVESITIHSYQNPPQVNLEVPPSVTSLSFTSSYSGDMYTFFLGDINECISAGLEEKITYVLDSNGTKTFNGRTYSPTSKYMVVLDCSAIPEGNQIIVDSILAFIKNFEVTKETRTITFNHSSSAKVYPYAQSSSGTISVVAGLYKKVASNGDYTDYEYVPSTDLSFGTDYYVMSLNTSSHYSFNPTFTKKVDANTTYYKQKTETIDGNSVTTYEVATTLEYGVTYYAENNGTYTSAFNVAKPSIVTFPMLNNKTAYTTTFKTDNPAIKDALTEGTSNNITIQVQHLDGTSWS